MTMKKFIQRARDWLIKKLGGYTQNEYEFINRTSIIAARTFNRSEIEVIKVDKVFDCFIFEEIWSEKDIRWFFAQEIAKILFERTDIMNLSKVISPTKDPLSVKFRAEVLIAKRYGGDYFGM